MNDIYKELMVRSMADASNVVDDLEEDYGIEIPAKTVGSMGMTLYQHRLADMEQKRREAEHEQSMGGLSPDRGTQ